MTHISRPVAAEAPRPGGWTIAELARQTELTPDTLRYYERIGLLPAPARTSGAHRRYGPDALDRLHFIQGARRLGLRLEEIGDLLAVRDTGNCPCEPAAALLSRRIADIDAEMARLSALRAELATMATALPADDCPNPAPGTWLPPQEVTR
ncbi:heavy metal-responsive transcriptional regulator [Streptomyces sp. 067-1]|uniref:heavy metal-responsive transcriptional regulator n=1 Tax=Streptomyces sp. 067-1 TaxID=2789269 RepID=UPI0039F50442